MSNNSQGELYFNLEVYSVQHFTRMQKYKIKISIHMDWYIYKFSNGLLWNTYLNSFKQLYILIYILLDMKNHSTT